MLELRDYQQRVIDDVRDRLKAGIRSILIQLPTGGGKTVLTAKMIGTAAAKDYRAWFTVHRRELIRQSTRTFHQVGIPHGLIAADAVMDIRRRVQIASIQTLVRRLERLAPPDLIVWDECHHLAAGTWARIYAEYPDAIHIGLSATPERLDGAGLAPFFQEMVHGPSVRELIDNGYLSPFRMFSMPSVNMDGADHKGGDFKRQDVIERMEKSTVIGDAVSHYVRHAMGRRGIAFECSIERSERLAEQFRAAGVPALHVDGNTDSTIRDRAMRDLEAGHLKILTNVDLFGEGVDVPAIEVIHCLRPTDSLGLWLQQCGRGLRPSPGKDHCVIFDHAGNLQRHGPPDLDREWTLAGHKDDKRGKGEGPGPRQCPSCFAMNAPAALVCLECRKPFPVQAREIEQVEGDLQEVEVAAMRRQAAHEQSMAEDYQSLVQLGRIRGYRNPEGWAEHVARGRIKALRMKGRALQADALEAQLPGKYSVRARA